MGEYEQHANELVEAMRDRHKNELKEFQETLLQKQQRPKVSSQFIIVNLRSSIFNLPVSEFRVNLSFQFFIY